MLSSRIRTQVGAVVAAGRPGCGMRRAPSRRGERRDSPASSTSSSSTPRTAASTICTGCSPAPTASPTPRPRPIAQVDRDGKRAAAAAAGVEGQGSRPRVPEGSAEPAVPHRRAADQPAAVGAHARRRSTSSTRTRSRSTAAATTASPPRRTPAALVMGYYDGSTLPLWAWAQEYALADNFFMGAFGGSFLNHFWLICACTPRGPERAGRRCVRRSTSAAGSRRKPGSPASVLIGPPAFLRRRRHARRLCGQHDAAAVAAVARAARQGRRPARHRSDAAHAAAADDDDDRRHAVRQGRHVGVVRRRMECRGEGRHAAARRAAQGHRRRRRTARRTSSRIISRSTISRASRPGTADRERHLKDYTDLVAGIDARVRCRRSRSTSRRAR